MPIDFANWSLAGRARSQFRFGLVCYRFCPNPPGNAFRAECCVVEGNGFRGRLPYVRGAGTAEINCTLGIGHKG